MRISRLSQRQVRIGSSVALAVLMVASAYAIPSLRFPGTKEANAALTDELLSKYVSKDTDGDGLPDWQEALYGTDPNKADTNGDGISDGEAVKRGLLTPTALKSQIPKDPVGTSVDDIPGLAPDPGSMTDEFSKAFFQSYVQASNGQPMDDATKQALLNKLLADFTQRASAILTSKYTIISVRTGSASGEAAYLSSVEAILLERSTIATKEDADPILLMQALVMKSDESARKKLMKLADLYDATTQKLLAVPVPPQYRDAHLTLIRSFDTLGKATHTVTNYERDPIATMGALAVLKPGMNGMLEGVQSMASTILQTHEPATGEPGGIIVSAARAAQQ